MKTLLAAVLMTALSAAAEDQTFRISCQTYGREFYCVSVGAEDLKIFPHWILHTKPPSESFGLDFRGKAPKHWTLLTANFYDYDTGAEKQACVEVMLIDGRAKFREPCIKKD